MSQMIHYRDDLFLLSMLAKSLEGAFSLDADPEFWKEKVLKDIFFFDETSLAIAALLSKNLHLVDRDEYLRLLERLALDFSRALGGLENAGSALTQSLEAQMPRILDIAAGQRELAQDLADSLSETESKKNSDSSIVSGDELARLLGDGQT